MAEAPDPEAVSPFAAVMHPSSIDLDATVYASEIQQACRRGDCEDGIEPVGLGRLWLFENLGTETDADRLVEAEGFFGRIYGAADLVRRNGGPEIGSRIELFIDGAVPWGRVMEMLVTAGHYGAREYGFVVESDAGASILSYDAIVSHADEDCVHLGLVLDSDSALLVGDTEPLEKLGKSIGWRHFTMEYGEQGLAPVHLSKFLDRFVDARLCEHVALQANPDLPWHRVAPVWASLDAAGAKPYVEEWIER